MRKRLQPSRSWSQGVSPCDFGLFFAASAQSLPRLNAQSISNRMFGINWPDTNAEFILQESGGLQAVSNWQASVLTPAFQLPSDGAQARARLTYSHSLPLLRTCSAPVGLRLRRIPMVAFPNNNSLLVERKGKRVGSNYLLRLLSWSR
jgi:hypothetical protein